MRLIDALICGVIQGLAEFLPISSSGHLALYHAIFGGADPGSELAFDLLLHLGTLAAVAAVYRRLIIRLIPAFFRMARKAFRGILRPERYDADERTCAALLIAVLPLALVKLLRLDAVAEALGSHVWIIGVMLIFNGLILRVSDTFSKRGRRNVPAPAGAIAVGLCQTVAVLPGLSRSGLTITGGLSQGLDGESAVRFSFLMSVPAIIGGNIFKLKDLLGQSGAGMGTAPALAGLAAAFVSGLAAEGPLIYV